MPPPPTHFIANLQERVVWKEPRNGCNPRRTWQHHNTELLVRNESEPEIVVLLHQQNHQSFPHLVATSG
jgi:hypothetical protein